MLQFLLYRMEGRMVCNVNDKLCKHKLQMQTKICHYCWTVFQKKIFEKDFWKYIFEYMCQPMFLSRFNPLFKTHLNIFTVITYLSQTEDIYQSQHT